jgi:hypothetical protein
MHFALRLTLQPADAGRRIARATFIVRAAATTRCNDADRRQRNQSASVIELTHLVKQTALLGHRRAELS